MTVNKRKKHVRLRGNTTHGWGARKKHRGSGNRGGAGMGGSGKRADSKKPSLWKTLDYFGKHGFKMKGAREKIKPINIIYLEENLKKLISNGKIKEIEGKYSVDLGQLGYNKLLGEGKVLNKFKIKTKYASTNAIDKVKSAGGEVIVG